MFKIRKTRSEKNRLEPDPNDHAYSESFYRFKIPPKKVDCLENNSYVRRQEQQKKKVETIVAVTGYEAHM